MRLRRGRWVFAAAALCAAAVTAAAMADSGGFTITTIAGNGKSGFSGDGGRATGAQLNYPTGIAVDAKGNVYVDDQVNLRLRKISPAGTITTIAGNGKAVNLHPRLVDKSGLATKLPLDLPTYVAVDKHGNIYITTSNFSRVRKVSPKGIIKTIAGRGGGFSGDGGPAIKAKLFGPEGIAIDGKGNLYVADYLNHRIRKINTGGIITTIAGNGKAGFSGDGGPAKRTQLNHPMGVAVDEQANVYIADFDNYRVRKVTPGGIITTIAGNGQDGSLSKVEGGPATSALGKPVDVAVDKQGNVYVTLPLRVRVITPGGTITTVAGTLRHDISRPCCFIPEGGPALSAELQEPLGVAVDGSGNVYLVDSWSQRVFKLTK